MPAKSAKELLAERARIDAAMMQLEHAKLKASARRAEYGKFLTWKVDLQRKERKQREEESQQLRERVEKKLTEVLEEHREHRKRETRAYRDFADSKVRRAQPLHISTSYDREDGIIAEARAEQERRKVEWQQFRAEMGLRSAPESLSRKRHQRVPSVEVSSAVAIQKTVQSSSAPGAFVAQTPRAPVQPRKDPIETDEDGYDMHLMRDKVGHVRGLVTTVQGGNEAALEELHAMRKSRLDALSLTEKRHDAVHQRASLMESMFNKARTRRIYAQNRIAADPPADYLIGTDILRYIPVDLIPGGAQFGEEHRQRGQLATTNDGNAFFMTAVDSSRADHAAPQLSTPQPDGNEEGRNAPHSTSLSKPRRQPTKAFDAQRWHQDKRLAAEVLPLRQERALDEEQAMYSWYKSHHLSASRSPRSGQYAWSKRQETMPAVGVTFPAKSIRLDPL